MGRTISTDLAAILADPARLMNWTVDITLPNATVYRFATAPLTLSGNTYTNDVESVQEIRQVLGGPIDRVKLALQNKDSVLGLDVQANPDQWRRAEAVIKRYYQSSDLSLDEWVPMFFGTFQQPMVTDLQITTDVVSDVASAGLIVVTRSLAPACPFKYKHAGTCGSTSSDPTCNHNLKSPGGCDGKANSHHYGGYEHRYPITRDVPGTGGNSTGGGYCPRVDQWIPTLGVAGRIGFRRASEIRRHDMIYSPLSRQFETVKSATIVPDQPIWKLAAAAGVAGYSSFSHPVFPHREHTKGMPVIEFSNDAGVLLWQAEDDILLDEYLTESKDTGELGDVVRIELYRGHVYAYGDRRDLFIVCHNSKPIEPI